MSTIKYIIVSATGDYTTKIIADWIKYYGGNVRIVNTDLEKVDIRSIKLNNNKNETVLSLSNEVILSNEVKKVVFFRRGLIRLLNSTNSFHSPSSFFDTESNVKYFFTTYEMSKREIVDNFFSENIKYGKDNGSRTNKIINLKAAQINGLNIPDTLVTISKKELIDWAKSKVKIITKALDTGMFFGNKTTKKMYHQLTKSISLNAIATFKNTFPLTLFQEKIEKILELRVFYLNKVCWSSAIISQSQENTLDDCRNYDPEQMNRVVPYKLPKNLQAKIIKFMVYIGMETGSLDIILSKDNKYYFLEVNPGGQFSSISNKCNFYLEKEIAKNMIYYGEKYN